MPDEVLTKACRQCGATHPLTPEFYGVQTASADGFRSVCRVCFSDNRSAQKMRDVKNLKNHDRIVKAAKKALEKPELLPPNQLHKMNQIVNGDEKKRAKLQAKIQEAHRAEEDARKALAAGPSLDRVRAMGNELFAADGTLLPVSERPAQLATFKAVLETLTGPADEAARAYLQTSIQALEQMLAASAEREAFLAEESQASINGSACQVAADAIHDKFAGLFGEGVSAVERDKLKALFQIVREEAQQQHKTIKPDEMTATGANRKVVSSRILEELTAIAGRLGKAGTEVGPGQTLENVQSLELGKVVGGMQMRRYVQSLLEKLERERATLSPEEYEKKRLNLPAAPKEETVVWRVQVGGKETWYWSDGRVVRKGTDVATSDLIKDPVHGWCLAPEPASVAIDDKPVGPMEAYQDEYDCTEDGAPKWKYRPANSGGEFVQQSDGTWRKVSGESPWDKPTKVVFKLATPPASPAHTEFRDGFFWTPDEVAKVEQGPDLKEPPVLLPPLERGKADCVATESPMTAEEIAKWSREPNRWRRWETKQREEKEAEAALLKGTFIWQTPA